MKNGDDWSGTVELIRSDMVHHGRYMDLLCLMRGMMHDDAHPKPHDTSLIMHSVRSSQRFYIYPTPPPPDGSRCLTFRSHHIQHQPEAVHVTVPHCRFISHFVSSTVRIHGHINATTTNTACRRLILYKISTRDSRTNLQLSLFIVERCPRI